MVNDLLYCVSMTDLSEIKGAAGEFLSVFYDNVSSWKDEESQVVRHTVYFLSDEEGKAEFEKIKENAKEWSEFGIVLDDFTYSTLKKENWAESWKLHFKTMAVSPRLVIKPSWEDFSPCAGQQVITLDPGMSFGTGQHATTKFCLQSIDEFTKDIGASCSFLDAGSGSGILSIAAKKLGCSPVKAFDIDPETIGIARENARINGISESDIEYKESALDNYDNKGYQFDLAAANILSSALIAGRKKLVSMVKPGGKLILAGILITEYPNVRKAFEEIGCKEIKTASEKEWQRGAFSVPEIQ